MSVLHFQNGGIVGGGERNLTQTSGVWKIGPRESPMKSLWLQVASTFSTALSFPIPTSQGNNSYYFSSRKLSIFYTDAYGTVTHINQNTASAASYTDARHIANDDGSGGSGTTLLVNNANSQTGYIYDEFVLVKGVRFYGTYSSATLQNQGPIIISTWDGSSWTDRASIAGNSSMNTAPGYTHTFSSAITCKGVSIRPGSISTYCPISYFAGIDGTTNTDILGLN